MAFLSRQTRSLRKLLAISAPDRLVASLADFRAMKPDCAIEGVHMYPLGGLRKTADWCRAVTDGRFTMNELGDGFTIDADNRAGAKPG